MVVVVGEGCVVGSSACPTSILSHGRPLEPTPLHRYHDFEAWQVPHQANYPLMDFSPAWNFATYVRVNCVFAHVDAGLCSNSVTGGKYAAGSAAAVTLQVLTTPTSSAEVSEEGGPGAVSAASDAVVIRYTTDGSAPSVSSPTYPLGGVVLSPLGATVHLRAMAWINGSASGQVTDAVYTAAA